MSRRIAFLSCAGLLCAGLIWWSAAGVAQEPVRLESNIVPRPAGWAIPGPPAGRAEGVFDLHKPSPAEETIQKALVDPKGVDIEFIDTPLKDMADFLEDAHDITIIIDEQALTEEGVAIDEPINRTLSGVKLGSALNIILDPLGLTYVVEDEVLKITTQIAADEKRHTRVYNVGYLQQVGIEAEDLQKTVQSVIEPDTWGPRRAAVTPAAAPQKSAPEPKKTKNSVEALGDMLVVSAPQSVHRKINSLLVQLDRRWEMQHGKK